MQEERSFCDMLFDDKVPVWINAKIKLAIMPKANIKHIKKVEPTACGVRGMTVEVESTDEEYIINRMRGMPVQTSDEEADLESASFLFVQDLPIEKIIEIWDLTGEVRFATGKALAHSYEVARNYLAEVEERMKYSVNFSGVPQEDIEKIRSFVEGIRYIYDTMNGDIAFDLALAEILQSAIFSNLFDNKKDDNQGLLVTRESSLNHDTMMQPTHQHAAFGFNRE
ncbi:hypothetical protein [Vibrio phage BONAISHI]|nr:hypothetical protein [Vibrio phage BONAISHI]